MWNAWLLPRPEVHSRALTPGLSQPAAAAPPAPAHEPAAAHVAGCQALCCCRAAAGSRARGIYGSLLAVVRKGQQVGGWEGFCGGSGKEGCECIWKTSAAAGSHGQLCARLCLLAVVCEGQWVGGKGGGRGGVH
eukprot:scaffold12096_cov24-Tisochrysis_lutea.AAC.1